MMMDALRPEKFEKTLDGKAVGLFFITGPNGMRAAVTNYGARFVGIFVQDRSGEWRDVVVGFDNIEGYLQSSEPYYSALVGRYANRIAHGRFSLHGKDYTLSTNNKPNHLHGGPGGFHNRVWTVTQQSESAITLEYISPDGEEGFPGTVTTSVHYSISDDNSLDISYSAHSDADTILNLTSHPYFNLNGQGNGSIEQQYLRIDADFYNPVNDTLIPTGISSVDGTPFDFRHAHPIGKDINRNDEQLLRGAGYDHNFILNGAGFREVATAFAEESGIEMQVWTDQPGLQLYTGNHMKGDNKIKYGMRDNKREGLCLETQHFPDSPNQPDFPSTVLRAGDQYQTRTAYRFSIRKD